MEICSRKSKDTVEAGCHACVSLCSESDIPVCLRENLIKILDRSFAGNPPDWLKDYGKEPELPKGTKGRLLYYSVQIEVEVKEDLLCSRNEYCGHKNGEILYYPEDMGRVCRHMIGQINEFAKGLQDGGIIPATAKGWSLWERRTKALPISIPCIDKSQCIYHLLRIFDPEGHLSPWD